MSARTHLFKKLIALLSVSFCAMANASYFGIDVNRESQGENNWNSRSGDGLLILLGNMPTISLSSRNLPCPQANGLRSPEAGAKAQPLSRSPAVCAYC